MDTWRRLQATRIHDPKNDPRSDVYTVLNSTGIHGERPICCLRHYLICVHVCQKNGNAQQCFTTFLLGELSEDGRVDDATAWDIKGAATVLYLGKGAQTTNDGLSPADMITTAGSDTVSVSSTHIIHDAYCH